MSGARDFSSRFQAAGTTATRICREARDEHTAKVFGLTGLLLASPDALAEALRDSVSPPDALWYKFEQELDELVEEARYDWEHAPAVREFIDGLSALLTAIGGRELSAKEPDPALQELTDALHRAKSEASDP